MSQNYFIHVCGHIGIGPVVRLTTPSPSPPQPTTHRTQVHLQFRCPFCTSRPDRITLPPGSGVLVILPDKLFPTAWTIVKECIPDELNPNDFNLAYQTPGKLRQMAWIPMPYGEIVGVAGEARVGVRSRWRQATDEPVKSRLPGIVSRWRALQGL